MSAEFDYAVIGNSISGVAAAITLGMTGKKVFMVECYTDTLSIQSIIKVHVPYIKGKVITGEEFLVLADKKLQEFDVVKSAGMFVPDAITVDENSSAIKLTDKIDGTITAKKIIFSPNGTEPGLPEGLQSQQLLGRGISYDAYSDMSFFRDAEVLIYGCGYRAWEQVYWASKWAKTVTVVCASKLINSDITDICLETGKVDIKENTILKSISTNHEGNVASVVLSCNGKDIELGAFCIFSANNPQPNWEFWKGKENYEMLIRTDYGYVSGFLNNISYWQHNALFSDGIRVAQHVNNR